MAAIAGSINRMRECPVGSALCMTVGTGCAGSGRSVVVRPGVAIIAAVAYGVHESPLVGGLVARVARLGRHVVVGLMAGLTRRGLHVVTALARRRWVPGKVGNALANRGDSRRGSGNQCIRVQDACCGERVFGDLMSCVGVTVDAAALFGVLCMREALSGRFRNIFVAARAASVRHVGRLCEREGGLAGDVYPDFFERNELVREAVRQTRVDVAVDARHLGVRAGLPRIVERCHLMAVGAERRLFGGPSNACRHHNDCRKYAEESEHGGGSVTEKPRPESVHLRVLTSFGLLWAVMYKNHRAPL